MPSFGPLEAFVLSVMGLVFLGFLGGITSVFMKYSRDRDRWNEVEKDRLARDERHEEEQ